MKPALFIKTSSIILILSLTTQSAFAHSQEKSHRKDGIKIYKVEESQLTEEEQAAQDKRNQRLKRTGQAVGVAGGITGGVLSGIGAANSMGAGIAIGTAGAIAASSVAAAATFGALAIPVAMVGMYYAGKHLMYPFKTRLMGVSSQARFALDEMANTIGKNEIFPKIRELFAIQKANGLFPKDHTGAGADRAYVDGEEDLWNDLVNDAHLTKDQILKLMGAKMGNADPIPANAADLVENKFLDQYKEMKTEDLLKARLNQICQAKGNQDGEAGDYEADMDRTILDGSRKTDLLSRKKLTAVDAEGKKRSYDYMKGFNHIVVTRLYCKDKTDGPTNRRNNLERIEDEQLRALGFQAPAVNLIDEKSIADRKGTLNKAMKGESGLSGAYFWRQGRANSGK